MPDVRIQLVGADTYRTLTHGFAKGQAYSIPQALWDTKFSKVTGPQGQRLFVLEGEALVDENQALQAAVGLTPNPNEPVPNIQTMAELLAGDDPVDEAPEGSEVTTLDPESNEVTSEVPEAPADQPVADPAPEAQVASTPEAPTTGGRRISVAGGKTSAVKV